MADHFISIFIRLNPKSSFEDLDKIMNLAIDWYRIDRSYWIVYTSSDIHKWMQRLKPITEPDGTLFITELNIVERNGWMTNKFWDWLKKER